MRALTATLSVSEVRLVTTRAIARFQQQRIAYQFIIANEYELGSLLKLPWPGQAVADASERRSNEETDS